MSTRPIVIRQMSFWLTFADIPAYSAVIAESITHRQELIVIILTFSLKLAIIYGEYKLAKLKRV